MRTNSGGSFATGGDERRWQFRKWWLVSLWAAMLLGFLISNFEYLIDLLVECGLNDKRI